MEPIGDTFFTEFVANLSIQRLCALIRKIAVLSHLGFMRKRSLQGLMLNSGVNALTYRTAAPESH